MKCALLCICPPYPMISPPAGAAALLGYLKAHGISDFGFVDLRLGTPSCYEATYSATGVFGESFVMDIPDLPLSKPTRTATCDLVHVAVFLIVAMLVAAGDTRLPTEPNEFVSMFRDPDSAWENRPLGEI